MTLRSGEEIITARHQLGGPLRGRWKWGARQVTVGPLDSAPTWVPHSLLRHPSNGEQRGRGWDTGRGAPGGESWKSQVRAPEDSVLRAGGLPLSPRVVGREAASQSLPLLIMPPSSHLHSLIWPNYPPKPPFLIPSRRGLGLQQDNSGPRGHNSPRTRDRHNGVTG